MKEIDAKHINVLEFPKLILWTDRDLEYFLEEMSSEECRMNNDVYDVLVKEVKAGQDYSLEEAFNLAYYECVRISWAKYPESKDLFYVLEMDIQNNQSHVDYGYTDLIMNMVWAMLHSTNTAKRFADKLHSYLYNNNKLKFNFRYFFTPNDYEPIIYPCEEKEEPRYNVNFSPCPEDIQYNSSNGEWCELTKGYKEHLIEELLLLWPEDKREYIRKCIMDEKAGQSEKFKDFAKKHIVEIIDEPESHLHVNLKESIIDQSVEDEINQLKKECDEWKAKHAKLEKILQARTDELDKWHYLFEEETKRTVMVDSLEKELDRWKKRCGELESKKEPEIAFNAQTGKTCFTSTQMGILFQAVSELTEPLPPGKTTLGDLIESIAGYSATTVNQNMKGAHRPKDIETIVEVLREKLPKLAEKVKKL